MFIKFPLKLRRSRCINKIKIKSGGWLVVQTGEVLSSGDVPTYFSIKAGNNSLRKIDKK